MALAPVGYYVTNQLVKNAVKYVSFEFEPLREEEYDVDGLLETGKGILKLYSGMEDNHVAFVSKELIAKSIETIERHITFAKHKKSKYWGWADFRKENQRIHIEVKKFEKRLSRFISLVQIRVPGKEFNTSRVILSRSD